MNEFLKVLLNIRSLRAAIRELPFEQLQEAKEKFDLVYNQGGIALC
jgi:DNA-binding protein H-NS